MGEADRDGHDVRRRLGDGFCGWLRRWASKISLADDQACPWWLRPTHLHIELPAAGWHGSWTGEDLRGDQTAPVAADLASGGFRGAWPVRLPPSQYRIESAELVCNGNCDHLSAPTDRCARTIRLDNGTLRIVIDAHAGRVCQINVT
jgi:hypothetical protein